jgi:hypothetical protein
MKNRVYVFTSQHRDNCDMPESLDETIAFLEQLRAEIPEQHRATARFEASHDGDVIDPRPQIKVWYGPA